MGTLHSIWNYVWFKKPRSRQTSGKWMKGLDRLWRSVCGTAFKINAENIHVLPLQITAYPKFGHLISQVCRCELPGDDQTEEEITLTFAQRTCLSSAWLSPPQTAAMFLTRNLKLKRALLLFANKCCPRWHAPTASLLSRCTSLRRCRDCWQERRLRPCQSFFCLLSFSSARCRVSNLTRPSVWRRCRGHDWGVIRFSRWKGWKSWSPAFCMATPQKTFTPANPDGDKPDRWNVPLPRTKGLR